MSGHSQIGNAGAHSPYRQLFANDAARTGDAGPYTAADAAARIKALQEDTGQEYALTNHSPITWTAVGGSGGGTPVEGGVQTTDATVTTLATYAMGTNSRGLFIKGAAQAYEPATEDHKVWSFTLRAHRDAGGVVTVENLHIDNGPDGTAGASAWTLTADVSGTTVRLRATGEAAHTIDWNALATALESI